MDTFQKGILSFLPSGRGDIAVASSSSEFHVPASGDRGDPSDFPLTHA